MKNNLSINFLGKQCENPYFLSSSVVGSNYEMVARAFEAGWAGVVFKSMATWTPDETSPRFSTIQKEGAQFVGFKNLEMNSTYPMETNLEFMARLKREFPEKIVIASIMGGPEQEWRLLAKASEEAGVDMIECNFSCPQMILGTMGSDVGEDPALVKRYCQVVRNTVSIPILAKTTPNVAHMEPAAISAIQGGADGIATINTIKCLFGFDSDNLTPLPGVDGKSSVSGYSGKAVKPIALRFIYDLACCEQLKGVGLSGMGGIETWKDALDFILLGCRNVQVTTAVMQYGYKIINDLISGMSHFLDQHGVDCIEQLVGAGLDKITPPELLERKSISTVRIRRERCIGCGRCYISCNDAGHQAVKWNASLRQPEISQDQCVGCHLCRLVCPTGALEATERVNIS